MPTFVASDERGTAGFASVNLHNEHSAEIHVIAVSPDRHRRGVGKALMERIESWLSADGVEYLQVKTLGPSRPDGPYALTREFYGSNTVRIDGTFNGEISSDDTLIVGESGQIQATIDSVRVVNVGEQE